MHHQASARPPRLPSAWRAALLSALAAVLSLASPQAEAATAEPVRVEARGPLECGNAERFLRLVLVRTPLARKAKEGEAGRTFQISLRRREDGAFDGEIVVIGAGSPPDESGRRSISDGSCGAVFDALTLFAALAVDPDASTASFPLDAEIGGEPRAPARGPAAHPPPQVTERTPRERGRTGERHASEKRWDWHLEGGAHAGASSAGLASPLLLAMPFVEGGFVEATPERIALAPAARLWFSSTGASTRSTVEGPAALRFTTVRLDACPLELRALPTLGVRPCLALAAGVLRARGETIAHPATVRRPWGTAGGVVRLAWRIFGFLSVEAALGVDLPFERDAFHFEPATPIYRVPVALGYGTAGLGVYFP
jgi:hypothetical protein